MQRVAILSDIHDNVPNLQKALDYIAKEKIEYIICTGDCQSMEIWTMLENAPQKTYAVLGNNDRHLLNEDNLKTYFKNMTVFPMWGSFKIGKRKILISHYISVLKDILDKEIDDYDLGLYGHTHKPWEEYYKNKKLLNPGNLANIYYPPSFAVIDLENLHAKLILLNTI